ncbi:MAG: PilW family protein [Ottowia sp.]|nr:PilW family protein [Ottowia sp.]
MAHLTTTPTTLRRLRRIARQRGLTLIELMVALVVGLMVILAALSVFTTTGRSAGTVDAAGQLRDDARFAADIIQRLAVQTGFEDIGFVTRTYQGTPQTYKAANGQVDPTGMMAPISGFSGKKPAAGNGAVTYNSSTKQLTVNEGDASYCPQAGKCSDTLVLRYQAVNKGDSLSDADGSMMVCSGDALGAGDAHDTEIRTERAVSVFYVDTDPETGEPTLYCRYTTKESGNLSTPATPLVKGVESFKVLYGVDNITANTKADASGADTGHAKLVPSRYLTAGEMAVSGDTAATQTNWRRVRTLRIGLVLRAGDRPIQRGQAVAQGDDATIYPLGEGFGGEYTINDARLRQPYIFTVNVRNCLNQGYQSAGDPGASASTDIPPCDVVVPRDPSTTGGSV